MYFKNIYMFNTQTLILDGQEWQSYFFFGQGGKIFVMNHFGNHSLDITVIAGPRPNYKAGSNIGEIEISNLNITGDIIIMSYRDFKISLK